VEFFEHRDGYFLVSAPLTAWELFAYYVVCRVCARYPLAILPPRRKSASN
jgi:hypothetical protein